MACQVEDPKTCTVTPNGSASPFNPTKPQKLRRLCSIDSQQDSDCWHKPQDDEVGFQIRFPSMPVPSNISYNDYMLSNCHVTCGPLDKLLGYDEDQVGHSLDWFQERFHPDDANTFDEICDHFARKENAGSADARHLKRSYRFKTYDGRWLLCGERINTVRKNGFPIFSEGYLFDLEARQEAATRAIKSFADEEDLQIVCGDFDSAVVMVNGVGHITFMNSAAETMVGYKLNDVQQLTFHEAMHSLRENETAYPMSECQLCQALENGQKLENQTETLVDVEGRFFPVRYSCAPLHGGKEHGAVIKFRDTTEEARQQEDRAETLRQNNEKSAQIQQEGYLRRSMAVFTDFLCHEVRNPLHGISANKTFLQESMNQLEDILNPMLESRKKPPGDQPQEGGGGGGGGEPSSADTVQSQTQTLLSSMKAYLQAIEECTAHQGTILNNVLDLSRLEMGALKLGSEPFCPYKIAMQAVKMSRAQAEGRQIKIALETDEASKTAVAKGDPTSVRQVILNLIGNGVKFSNPGGTVTVRIKLRQWDHTNQLRMEGSVADEGVGMTSTEVGRLFHRFAQANRRVSEVYGGSGLGLSISKELLKLMDGNLDVESEKGKGSTFMFTAMFNNVPLSELNEWQEKQEKANKDSSNSKNSASGGRKTSLRKTPSRFKSILAAEDNALNRKILGKYLQKYDHITLVNDGQKAVDYYKEHSQEIDIIIMDQEMPDVDGREATMMIREFEKELQTEDESSDKEPTKGHKRRTRDWSYHVPIIALSGNVRSEHIATAKQAGIDDYLNKPCPKQSLEEMMVKWEGIVLGPEQAEESGTQTPTQQRTGTTTRSADPGALAQLDNMPDGEIKDPPRAFPHRHDSSAQPEGPEEFDDKERHHQENND